MRLAVVLACCLVGLAGAACAGVPPTTPVTRKAGWWKASHRQINARVKRGGVELIFVGDSITSGWAREGKAVWDKHYGRRKAANLGIGGDETGHVLWRLTHGNLRGISPKVKVAVLLVGVNNAYRRDHSAAAIAEGIKRIVAELRRRLPRTKVLVLAIFPAGARPGRFREKTGAINKRVAKLADGKMVHFLDIGARFLGKNGHISQEVMHDYLHLTEKGYRIWAEAMEPTLKRLLRAKD
jgi:beta-glucosidase